jgi:predicted nuclease with TOPRIM domain
MTTTTTTEAPAGYAELEAARAELETAWQERARLGGEYRKFAADLGKVKAELRELATSEPNQFGPDGQPKPKTQAAKLRTKLEQRASSQWPDVIRGADQRVEACEAEVRRLTRPLAVELARAEYQKGLGAMREAQALRGQLREAIARVHATEPERLRDRFSGLHRQAALQDDRPQDHRRPC